MGNTHLTPTRRQAEIMSSSSACSQSPDGSLCAVSNVYLLHACKLHSWLHFAFILCQQVIVSEEILFCTLMRTATMATPVTFIWRFLSTKASLALLKRSLSSGHGQKQQAGMCYGTAARTACFHGSKDQAVMDLQAHSSFGKLFQVSRRKMELLCALTL